MLPNSTNATYLLASEGFADLGLWLDANAELERIQPEHRDSSQVLAVRLRIYRAMEKWELSR
jgi:hypothetical protein